MTAQKTLREEVSACEMISLASLLPQARRAAPDHGDSLALALAAVAGCGLADIARVAEEQLSLPFCALSAMQERAPAFDILSFTECAQRLVYPQREPDGYRFVVADPWDNDVFQWLVHRVGSYPRLVWGERGDIVKALDQAKQHIKASADLPVSTANFATRSEAAGAGSISIETIEGSSSPVVRFVDAVIYDAWNVGASDIHFECGRNGVQTKLRLDGVLVAGARLDDSLQAEQVISRIKVLAQLDIAERRVPQDGRFQMSIGARLLDFRVSIMPSMHGEDAVVRLLDKSHLRGEAAAISLSSLGLDDDAIARIRQLAKAPHGMLLVTGPTGSGKTTTLYAALTEIQSGREKIITIEDPVEYELPGVLQIPVNEKKGLTFSKGLRSILRHDPDKILVGEIRDRETAEIAIQAALTGHLVFTTVHANSVYDVISRFVHMEIDLYSLVSALKGVVAQRLIRCNCPHCSEDVAVDAILRSRLESLQLHGAHLRLKRGRGCALCRQTGYKGRHAIAEVLPLDDGLRSMILRRADPEEIKSRALALGVRPLLVSAFSLLIAGLTTLEEIDRVVAYD